MEHKTIDEWAAVYQKKTGKPFVHDDKFKLFFFPERGFCEIGVDGNEKIVVMNQVCGDGWFWRRLAEFLAESLGYQTCGTMFLRNVKANMRLWGFTEVSEKNTDDGVPRYFGKDRYGNEMHCSPAWVDNTGKHIYNAVWTFKNKGGGEHGVSV